MKKPHRPVVAACLATVLAGMATATAANAAHADPRADARQAACAYGHVLANYDYTHLQGYFAQESSGATGNWKAQVVSNSIDLSRILTSNQVRSVPTSVSCTVLSLNGNRAQVAMNIGSLVSSSASQGLPQPSQSTPTFTLYNVNGRWLVGDIITN